MKILIIALSGIGDALMFTPAAALIRKHFPDAQMDALVMFRGVEDIYRRTGYFSNVHFFDYMHASKFSALQFTLGLRGKYDYSISVYPANRREYNGIGYLIGARNRGAVRYIRNDFMHFGFLNTVTVPESDTLHNVEENILLVKKMFHISDESIMPLNFPLTAEDEQFAENFWQSHEIRPYHQVVGIHAGCSTLKNHIHRRWEPEKFASLARQLAERVNTHVLIFGGPEEETLKQEILAKAAMPNVYAVQAKNLAQSAALIKTCSFFVTNDSSLLHVASAMQRKVLAIIGPTNTHYIHPWATEYKIASLHLQCAPCFFYSPKPLQCSRTDVQYKCVRELSVLHVWQQLQDWLT